MKKSKLTLRALTEGAILIAAAQVLSYLKLWRMPWGGSITLAMVPIILYAVRWGLGPGLLAGFVYGIMQFMFDGGIALGWQSIIGDYLLAYGALGFAGLAPGTQGGMFIGPVIGGLCRFLVHYVVGATVWAEYMPESFFGMTMHSPWFYSLLYNLAYMLPNILICLLVFALLWVPMRKYLTGADLKKT